MRYWWDFNNKILLLFPASKFFSLVIFYLCSSFIFMIFVRVLIICVLGLVRYMPARCVQSFMLIRARVTLIIVHIHYELSFSLSLSLSLYIYIYIYVHQSNVYTENGKACAEAFTLPVNLYDCVVSRLRINFSHHIVTKWHRTNQAQSPWQLYTVLSDRFG